METEDVKLNYGFFFGIQYVKCYESCLLQVTKENKALKRQSQALLPLIPELPESLDLMTLDLESDSGNDPGTAEDMEAEPLLQSQAQIQGGSDL